MARGTPHTDETRAQATAALLAGQGVREVSRATGVPLATVSRIKKELAAPRAAAALKDLTSHVPTKSAPRIEEDFNPDDSETFDEDVDAGLRDDWQNGRIDFEFDTPDQAYQCPVSANYRVPVSAPMEQVGTQKKQPPSLDELICGLLTENLQTLRDQAIIARDPRWIKRYSPNELAVLHGVMSDKVLRLLEFAEAAKPLESAPLESEVSPSG